MSSYNNLYMNNLCQSLKSKYSNEQTDIIQHITWFSERRDCDPTRNLILSVSAVCAVRERACKFKINKLFIFLIIFLKHLNWNYWFTFMSILFFILITESVSVYGNVPRQAQLQPSPTHLSLIHIKDLGGSRPWSQRSPGWVLWSLLEEGCSTLEWS